MVSHESTALKVAVTCQGMQKVKGVFTLKKVRQLSIIQIGTIFVSAVDSHRRSH